MGPASFGVRSRLAEAVGEVARKCRHKGRRDRPQRDLVDTHPGFDHITVLVVCRLSVGVSGLIDLRPLFGHPIHAVVPVVHLCAVTCGDGRNRAVRVILGGRRSVIEFVRRDRDLPTGVVHGFSDR